MRDALRDMFARRAEARTGAPAEYLIVGLGNPGSEYRRTRHNVGFMLVEELAQRCGGKWSRPRNQARWVTCCLAGRQVALVEPLTYMNLSGRAVERALKQFGLKSDALLVVHDDLDLPFGRIRLRPGGSSGGHKGVQSTIDVLRTKEFARLRLGIGRPDERDEVTDFVLSRFEGDEPRDVIEMLERASKAVEVFVDQGISAAMNQFNSGD